MNTNESLIEHFGGLNKVKDLIHSHAFDDVYCPGNRKWFTGAYWNLHMKGHSGIEMGQLANAFYVFPKIIFLGGVCNGKLSPFEYMGQREVKVEHRLPIPPIHDYSAFEEYASEIAVPIEIKFDIYHVKDFILNRQRRLFLVFPELLNDQEQLLKLVTKHWQCGYRVNG